MQDLIPIFLAMATAGALGGFLSGLMGIGGGIVMVPVLYTAFSFVGAPDAYTMHLAVATSLGIIVPTAFFSARSHKKRGAFVIEITKIWTPWMVTGAVLGTVLAAYLKSDALALFFAVMAALMGMKLLLPLEDIVISKNVPNRTTSGALGLSIGVASSLMGIGGATFSVPTMTLFAIPIHKAVGTAAFMGVFVAAFAATGFIIAGWSVPGLPPYSLGFVNLVGVAVVAPISSMMAPLGVATAHKLARRKLSILFGLFLILAAGRMAYPALFS